MLDSILKHSLFFPPKEFSAPLKAQLFCTSNNFLPKNLFVFFSIFFDLSKKRNCLDRQFSRQKTTFFGSFKSAMYNSFIQAFSTFFLVSCISVIAHKRHSPFKEAIKDMSFISISKFLETPGQLLQPEIRKKYLN